MPSRDPDVGCAISLSACFGLARVRKPRGKAYRHSTMNRSLHLPYYWASPSAYSMHGRS